MKVISDTVSGATLKRICQCDFSRVSEGTEYPSTTCYFTLNQASEAIGAESHPWSTLSGWLGKVYSAGYVDRAANRDPKWHGCKNHKEAVALLTHGIKGTEYDDLESAVAKLSAAVSDTAPRYEPALDISGGCPDLEQYLQGAPECMVTLAPAPDTKRVVSIGINGSYSATTEPGDLQRRGKAAFAVQRALELAGYSTRIDWLFPSMYQPRYLGFTEAVVTLKEAGEYLSPHVAATWLYSHVALRVAGFALIEHGLPLELAKRFLSEGHTEPFQPDTVNGTPCESPRASDYQVYWGLLDSQTAKRTPAQWLDNARAQLRLLDIDLGGAL